MTMLFTDSLFTVSGFLNNEDNAYQGGFDGFAGVVGQLGKIAAYTTQEIAALSKSSVGTLYGGLYQVVKFKSGTSASNARGQLVFWSTPGSFEVTPDATSALEGAIAGVTLNAVTKGNYGIIQVAGIASVLFRASVTDKTAGNLVIQLTTTATADAIAESTGSYISGGVKGLKNIIGTAYEAPSDGGITRVWLKNLGLNI